MFDFIKNEHEILKLWRERNVFEQMSEKNKNSKEIFRTLDGPITANGSMCLHHVWGRSFKDAILKYNSLKGRKAQFQNGFDAQGMWVEVEVEKLLGLNDKKAILDYGLGKFTEKCIERVNYFADMQTRQSIRLGQIMDWDGSYFTNSDHNIECIWHFLKVCHKRGMIKRSYKSMPWCPRCGTSLSEHEMNGSYKELTHKAVFVKCKIKNSNFKIIIWTTTPWTLCANVAIAVNPEHKYLKIRVKSDSDFLIIGKDALKIIKKADFIEVVEEFDGKELVGTEYEPILPLKIQNFKHEIIPWDQVSSTDGSGAVHIAPGCGAEDFELGKKFGLRAIVPINEAGIFIDEFEWLAGLGTDKCDEVVFGKLRENGTMFYEHDFKHNYPFCWRCKTNVVFKLVDGWDIATDEIRPELLKAVRTVKWQPPFLQKSMENWLETMGDWNISRRRFYGLPLPIYPCECGNFTVIGSRKELKELAAEPGLVDKIPHLHRPYIDEIQIKCPKCGKPVKRIPDVGDCWLDAGITPFSTKKYFTDKKYWREHFPSRVVIEMKEQIRLWFYSLLFMSVVLTGEAPYEEVVGYGIILDEDGKKFSKTGKNNIKFDDAAEIYGADVMRYLFALANPANDMRIGQTLIDGARRKLLGFYNSFVFFDTYFAVDRPDLTNYLPRNPDITDIWLVHVLNKYIADCDRSYAGFNLQQVVENTEKLAEDLSNFYIRVNRRRFWKNANDTDKMNAYWALLGAIKTVTVVTAPITPFLCEYIWRKTSFARCGAEDSGLCMTADFPEPISMSGVDLRAYVGIAEEVVFIKRIISLALSLRAGEQLKLRQPLRTLYIKTGAEHNGVLNRFAYILRDEVNVKNVEIVDSDDRFNIPYLTVNFKKAGTVLKDGVQELKNLLENLDPEAMAKAVADFSSGKVAIGRFKNLSADLFALKLKSRTEFVSSTEDDITVVLDTVIDSALAEEGVLREIIRGIQVARQDANFEITSRIKLWLDTDNTPFSKVVATGREFICGEVLASELADTAFDGHKFTVEIDGYKIYGTMV
jgi:isoleucyl-tRNA synthetase